MRVCMGCWRRSIIAIIFEEGIERVIYNIWKKLMKYAL